LRKIKIKITHATDLSQALENFRAKCKTFSISNTEQEALFSKVRSEAGDLFRRGRELSSIGSQFRVKRVIESESCQVLLDVAFGSEQPTFMSKLRSLFSKS